MMGHISQAGATQNFGHMQGPWLPATPRLCLVSLFSAALQVKDLRAVPSETRGLVFFFEQKPRIPTKWGSAKQPVI